MNINRKYLITLALIIAILVGGKMLLTTKKSPREQMNQAVLEVFQARTQKEFDRANKKIDKLSKKYNISPHSFGD